MLDQRAESVETTRYAMTLHVRAAGGSKSAIPTANGRRRTDIGTAGAHAATHRRNQTDGARALGDITLLSQTKRTTILDAWSLGKKDSTTPHSDEADRAQVREQPRRDGRRL